jgi:hypothetical protein
MGKINEKNKTENRRAICLRVISGVKELLLEDFDIKIITVRLIIKKFHAINSLYVEKNIPSLRNFNRIYDETEKSLQAFRNAYKKDRSLNCVYIKFKTCKVSDSIGLVLVIDLSDLFS